jgi:type II secretory pathway pseudopilin PulG
MEPTLPIEDTPRLPRPDTVQWAWGLDVLMAIAILLVLNALAMTSASMAIYKAKATEQMLAGTTWRANVIEHFAVTGEWQVSEGDLPRDFAAARLEAIKWQSKYAAAGLVDGVIVTLGRYPGHLDGTAIVTFRPAVAKGQVQPTVRWLCGHAATPPGWEGPQVSPAANLPNDYLYSLCRNLKTG